jgi:hypothetical protein
MADHATTEMTTPHGDVVAIDTAIAPFIARLWALNLMTLNSCEDNFGYVWVELFPEHLERLLTILANGDDDFLWERAREPVGLSPHDRERLVTQYRVPADSWLLDVCAQQDDDDPAIYLTVSLRFPKEQLALVEAALARFDGC